MLLRKGLSVLVDDEAASSALATPHPSPTDAAPSDHFAHCVLAVGCPPLQDGQGPRNKVFFCNRRGVSFSPVAVLGLRIVTVVADLLH